MKKSDEFFIYFDGLNFDLIILSFFPNSSITKDSEEHLTHTHFVAEGEVTFKSLLYIPKVQPAERYVLF